MSKVTIDWPTINERIAIAGEFFAKDERNRKIVGNLLDWYEDKSIKKTPVVDYADPNFKNWVVGGIPHMKNMAKLFDSYIELIKRKLGGIEAERLRSEQKQKQWSVYYTGIGNLTDLLVRFLGCRSDATIWYLDLLKKYQSDPKVAKHIGYFMDVCLESRRQLLARKAFLNL